MYNIEKEVEIVKNSFLCKDILFEGQIETDKKKVKNRLEKPLDIFTCGKHLKRLEEQFGKSIIGQDEMKHKLVLALILNEHALLEGLPGVGKTFMIKSIGEDVGLPFQRVQFIPDMLPSDLVGKDYIDPILLTKASSDAVQWINGPLFSSLVLADEINRAPSKVQAALLEAMGEAQITPFGKKTMMVRNAIHEAAIKVRWKNEKENGGLFGLPGIHPDQKNLCQFNVFATMNPIEQEGTYPLSEAQLDRFCFKINVSYPERMCYEEIAVTAIKGDDEPRELKVVYGTAKCKDYEEYFERHPEETIPILAPVYFFLLCRDHIWGFLSHNGNSLWERFRKNPKYQKKINDIVYFSNLRNPGNMISKHEKMEAEKMAHYIYNMEKKDRERILELCSQNSFKFIRAGSSPRGFLKLTKAVLAEVLMDDKNSFSDDYIRRNVNDILKHRIRLDVQAKLESITSEDVLDKLCDTILG